MDISIAILLVILGAYALVAGRLERLSISPAMAFVLVGLIVAADPLGPISFASGAEQIQLLAEITLTLLLFSDASSIRLTELRLDARPIGRLLGGGLPLTILLGTILAMLLFPAASVGLALVIGATLAPTDAALGQPVVTNQAVPARIRRILNVESGLNDGIATPFVFLGLGLAASEATGVSSWLVDAILEAGIGLAVGLALGFAGGILLRAADRAGYTTHDSSRLFVLALALACYAIAVLVGGNGFIAAFVGGLAFGKGSKHTEGHAVEFTETQGSLLAIGVWTAFGILVANQLGTAINDGQAIVYAALSLTLVRMVPVALSLIGVGFRLPTVLFMGWFGPRGLASIVFLFIALSELRAAGVIAGPLADVVAWTVFLSVILHGITAYPLARRFGRFTRGLPESAPELLDVPEPSHRRKSWTRPMPVTT